MQKGFSLLRVILLSTFLSLSAPLASLAFPKVATLPSAHVQEVFDGLKVPWGFDFITPHKIVITERHGEMHLFDLKEQKATTILGVPKVAHFGQGGLLDVAAHPQFDKTKEIYFTYAISLESGYTTRLAKAKLSGHKLTGLKTLFTASPASPSTRHFGSRLAFDSNGYLYMSIGDRGDRNKAQRLDSHHGKVIRLRLDGQIPDSNPFFYKKGAQKEIWTFGHRNPQGMARHPSTGEIWLNEHGPKGGDEINILKRGANYGWPVITYGREYSGQKIGTTHREGMEQPLFYFTPSIAPSGMTIYSGDKFKDFLGDVFSGALALTHLNRLSLDGNQKVIRQERMLESWQERIRNVKTGPDGYIYFSTDSGSIMRLVPK